MKLGQAARLAGFGIGCVIGTVHAADHFPVARITTGEGYSITAVQRARPDAKTCEAANARFTEPFKAQCESCQVQWSRCKTRLDPQESAAVAGKPLKSYSVALPAVRMILTGDGAKAACERIAFQTRQQGVQQAKCLGPGAAGLSPPP
jgi:hypothetical protein